MWEGENPVAPVESDAQKPNYSKFLSNYNEEQRSGKVPYVFDYIPSMFLKSPSLQRSYNDFAIKHGSGLRKQTKGTVLLTYYRSGSSFLGQLFNQHPDVFYHFEPLFPYSRDCSSDSPAFKKEKIENLERILSCDMPNMRNLTQKIQHFNPNLYNSRLCLLTGACFRFNSLSLCDPRLCPPMPGGELKCSSCGPLNLELTDDLCREKEMTVVKTIRICNGSWLDSISKSMSLKVVHLIRDPRAIAKSRLSIPDDPITEAEIVKNVTDLCKQQMLTHEKYFGSDDYSTVLYEDLNRMPFDKTQEIYDFVGLTFHPKVKGWIRQNTGASRVRRESLDLKDFHVAKRTMIDDKEVILYEDNAGHNYTKTKFKVKETQDMLLQNSMPDMSKIIVQEVNSPDRKRTVVHNQILEARNPFGTYRNSATVLETWPSKLPFEIVDGIQKGCSELMEEFGYKFVRSKEEYEDKNPSYLPELQ
ncbi:Oidioi.mRNA.OKI2018_I69.chr2.g7513.t1.cds [Oikopleura dioica]|uniref:Sulfotransferase n=1 Tax=Oikopleura dioica TaxID=34765 RepID=A0ABN7T9Y3_OIKDI|nr:Oidioi.mRNA.OKI2018_I69.chr2.g7513.t1.cds [Oikopleura dioica]